MEEPTKDQFTALNATSPIAVSSDKFIGFMLFFVWVYLLFFDAPSICLHISQDYSFSGAFVCFGVVGALGICYFFADNDKFRTNSATLFLDAALVLESILLLVLMSSLPLVIVSVNSLFIGMATGHVFVRWVACLSRDATPQAPILLILEMSLATLGGFLIVSADESIRCYLALCVFCCSVCILVKSNKSEPCVSTVPKEISRKRRPMLWKTHVMFGLFGFGFGMTLFMLATLETPVAATIVALLGFVGAFLDIRHAGGVYPERMKRIMLVSIVALLLTIMVFGSSVEVFCWNVLVGFFMYFLSVQMNWMIYSGHRFQLNIDAFLPEAHILIWAGAGIGFATTWVAGINSLDNVLLGFFIFLLVLAYALFTPKDLEGLALLVFKDFDQSDDSFHGGDDVTKRVNFVRCCDEIAALYSLTSRETEIMALLARGRNAEYIGTKLVISVHTAKTHIYHIYQKLGINSQQALIDMVDNYYKRQ